MYKPFLFLLCVILFAANAEDYGTPPGEKITPFEKEIQKASRAYGVKSSIIKAIIKQESAFNPNAVSHMGAGGLMQLMPKTAKWIGVENVFDPQENVMGGTKYIGSKLKEQHGDLCKALASYNWGIGNMTKLIAKKGTTNCEALIPFMPEETRNYIVKVIKNAKDYGWDGSIDLAAIENAAGSPIDINEGGFVAAEDQTRFKAFYEEFFQRVDNILNKLNENYFTKMFEAIKPALNALLTIWIIASALNIYRGNETFTDFVYNKVRLIFILSLAINFASYKELIYEPLAAADDYYISMFFPDAQSIGESLDMFAARMAMAFGHLLQTSNGIAQGLVIEIMYILFNWMTSFFSAMFTFAGVGLFICTFFAPIFIILFIFNATRPLTLRWFQLMLFFAVVKILISFMLYFMYGIGLNEISNRAYNDLGDFLSPFILMIICIWMLADISRFAVGLVGGYDAPFPGLIGKQYLKSLGRRKARQQGKRVARGGAYLGKAINKKAKQGYNKAHDLAKSYKSS